MNLASLALKYAREVAGDESWPNLLAVISELIKNTFPRVESRQIFAASYQGGYFLYTF